MLLLLGLRLPLLKINKLFEIFMSFSFHCLVQFCVQPLLYFFAFKGIRASEISFASEAFKIRQTKRNSFLRPLWTLYGQYFHHYLRTHSFIHAHSMSLVCCSCSGYGFRFSTSTNCLRYSCHFHFIAGLLLPLLNINKLFEIFISFSFHCWVTSSASQH